MNKILLVLAHPALEFSKVNKRMLTAASTLVGKSVQIRDLYELYPRFNIDTQKEKDFIEKNDIIIFQHPFYWYGVPALLKQYIDTVFTNGWAYGKGSNILNGKVLFNAFTTNGTKESYHTNGANRFQISDFLSPFDQLAYVCKMDYLPPFVLNESGKATLETRLHHAELYKELLTLLASGNIEINRLQQLTYLDEFKNLDKIIK